MRKDDAIQTLIYDAQTDRSSRTSYRRVLKALKALGLTDEEQKTVLINLNYCNHFGGLYERYEEPVHTKAKP